MFDKVDLEGLVVKVSNAKKELKRAKEEENRLSGELKKELSASGISKMDFPELKLKVAYTPSIKSTMNEELLLKVLKDIIDNTSNSEVKENVQECIKLVEQVDESKVTDLVYSGVLDIEDIKPAYEEKITNTLRVGDMK